MTPRGAGFRVYGAGTVEFFNMILGTKLTALEKDALVAFLAVP